MTHGLLIHFAASTTAGAWLTLRPRSRPSRGSSRPPPPPSSSSTGRTASCPCGTSRSSSRRPSWETTLTFVLSPPIMTKRGFRHRVPWSHTDNELVFLSVGGFHAPVDADVDALPIGSEVGRSRGGARLRADRRQGHQHQHWNGTTQSSVDQYSQWSV